MSAEPNTFDLDDGGELLAPVSIELFDRKHKVDFVYRAHLYTPAFLAEGHTISEALIAMVQSWGLMRKGEPVPLTPEGLATVPLAVMQAVWNGIREDFDPNPTWSGGSVSTS